MSITYHEKELKDLLEDIDTLRVVLPSFQRGYVWDIDKQKDLLASLLVNLPSGSLLMIEGNKNTFSTRKLCLPRLTYVKTPKCNFLLDGQQRLTTIYNILFDNYEKKWDDIWDNIYGSLRYRWCICLKAMNEKQDIWGYNS
jgi:uncharacterized protein with ParB-like and HNH nuclease domain